MSFVERTIERYRGYVENPDPLARAGNAIALFILSNQPFYPLYLYLLIGDRCWPSLITLLSSPLFLAVPALMRRNAKAGKWLLIFASVGNTLLAIKALGPESGLELFYFPCAVLGALLFSANERAASWLASVGPIALFLLLRARYGAPLESFSGAEYGTMLTLHAVSAAAICVFVCFTMAGAIRERAR